MRDRTVFVLFGPKGVGKTHIARLLRSILGIHHVDADPIVLDLMSKGIQPDPTYGWLEPVQRAVEEALTDHSVVAMEGHRRLANRLGDRSAVEQQRSRSTDCEGNCAKGSGGSAPRQPYGTSRSNFQV